MQNPVQQVHAPDAGGAPALATSGAITFRLRGMHVASSTVPACEDFQTSVDLKGFSIDVRPPADRQGMP